MNKKMIFITQEENLVFFWQTYLSNLASTTMESILVFNKHLLFFTVLSIILSVYDWLFNKPPTENGRVNLSSSRDSEREPPSDPSSNGVLRFLAVILVNFLETFGSCEDSCDGSVNTNAAISTNSDGSGEASNCSADTDAPVVPVLEPEIPVEVGGSRTTIEENGSGLRIEDDK